ncbi:MAG: type IV pili methyl-accepting chemotaxis transducer N-terminal domain-containing protein [Rhodocyclaceae bacterium]|jgi:hypothetical protein|nr:type IV pili methyl-accepting chemotaxis transducer N-terminal domain-containing protein [Rhodocyclaceae bacterium]
MIIGYRAARVAMLALLLALLGFASAAQAQIADINTAINKAGRERMLSQRMAKAYFQIGQGIDLYRSQRVLDNSIALFDRQLVELKNFAPNAEIRDTYLLLERAWIAYKDALVGAPPSQDRGKRVLELSEEVLALAHQGTMQLERVSGTIAGRLVNVSGRQRMLSQRMAKFYQGIAWGIGGPEAMTELDKARQEFTAALQELISAPINTPELLRELDLVKQQWFFFEEALNQRNLNTATNHGKTLATNVATTSERILETMEGIVAMYEKQP